MGIVTKLNCEDGYIIKRISPTTMSLCERFSVTKEGVSTVISQVYSPDARGPVTFSTSWFGLVASPWREKKMKIGTIFFSKNDQHSRLF